MLDYLKNLLYFNKYKTHSEAVIIACYFNPQNSPYRLRAFNKFYDSIKHLNHRIIECVIGDSVAQLPENDNFIRVFTPNLLWHKESLLNKVVSELPEKYKYVFWIDADVLFTNKNWLVDSVAALQTANIVQPFEYCVHLDRDQTEPSFNVDDYRATVSDPTKRHKKMWRSFSANHGTLSGHENYDVHGHVGFAWGARRDVLDQVPLYDHALIGGADHIIAHAAAGQIPHKCIAKTFTENIDSVNEWSRRFYDVVQGKIGYATGDLYHIWHGGIEKRQYLKRIQDFTPKSKTITQRDENGLYVTDSYVDDDYILTYFATREVLDLIDDSNNVNEFGGFGGGHSGGGGAVGSFAPETSPVPQQNPDAAFEKAVVGAALAQSGEYIADNVQYLTDDPHGLDSVGIAEGNAQDASFDNIDTTPADSTSYPESENFS